MRGRIAAVAAVATLAVAGTAVAAGGGPIGGVFGDDRKQELAQDLADQLDGVNANEVERALDSVAEQRMAEHRAAIAEAIAAGLDGVDADQVADALAKHEEQMRSAFENGERADMGSLATTLANELGVSEDEVTAALESARESAFEDHRADALQRLDEAVEKGDISEEQADQIRERLESGPPAGGPGGPGFGGPGHHRGPGGPGFGPGGPGFGPGGAEGNGEGASAPAAGADSSAA